MLPFPELSLTNLTAGATYYIEQADSLVSNDWKEVHSFKGISSSTHWQIAAATGGFSAS